MVQHLLENSFNYLLSIFNLLWQWSEVPAGWWVADIIPVLKPRKDDTILANYKPISLMSCLSKTRQRMVIWCLSWFLERCNLLLDVQCGFHVGISLVNYLASFETAMWEAFLQCGMPSLAWRRGMLPPGTFTLWRPCMYGAQGQTPSVPAELPVTSEYGTAWQPCAALDRSCCWWHWYPAFGIILTISYWGVSGELTNLKTINGLFYVIII